MLTPEYMQKLPNTILSYYKDLEDRIIVDVIKKLNTLNNTSEDAEYLLSVAFNLGYDTSEIKKEIAKQTKVSEKVLDDLIENAAKRSYLADADIYKKGGKILKPYKENEAVLRSVEAAKKFSKGNLKNITRTLGLNGKPLETYYQEKLSQAVVDINTGAYSPKQIVDKTVNELSAKGLQVISYESGRNYSIDAAVRMIVMTTVNNLAGEMALMNAADMGQDLMEITAHAGARPSHQEWQGQIVSLSGQAGYLGLDDIGYGDAGGFKGVYCRHDWYPYFEGISKPAWSKEDLENIDPPPFEYGDRTYTYYEGTQRQRAYERKIRNVNKKIKMYEAIDDEEKALIEKIKEKRYLDEYTKFSKAAGLKVNKYVLGK